MLVDFVLEIFDGSRKQIQVKFLLKFYKYPYEKFTVEMFICS